MFCRKCGTEITRENAKFCNKCGCALSGVESNVENISAATKNSEVIQGIKGQPEDTNAVTLPKVNSKLNKKVIVIIAVIVLVLCAIPAAKAVFKPEGPQAVVKEFLKELKAGNYEKAYSYIDNSKLLNEQFLNYEDFRKSFEKEKITDFNIVKDKSKSDNSKMSDYKVKAKMTHGGQKVENTFVLVNVSDEKKPEWKIDPESFIVQTQVKTLVGIDIEINGKKVNINTEGNAAVRMFKNYPIHVRLANSDILPVETDTISGSCLEFYEFQPGEAFKKTVEDIIVGYNKNALPKFYRNYSISDVEGYIKVYSGIWSELYKDQIIKPLAEEYKSIEIEIEDIEFLDDPNTLDVSNINKIVVSTNEKWFFGGKEDSGELVYYMEKLPNGNWLITDIG